MKLGYRIPHAWPAFLSARDPREFVASIAPRYRRSVPGFASERSSDRRALGTLHELARSFAAYVQHARVVNSAMPADGALRTPEAVMHRGLPCRLCSIRLV